MKFFSLPDQRRLASEIPKDPETPITPANTDYVEKYGRNYPSRNLTMAVLAMPMFLFATVLVSVPAIVTKGLDMSISTAVLLTALAEILVLMFALKYTNSFDILKERLRVGNFKWWTLLTGMGAGALLFVGLQVFSTLISNAFPSNTVESSDTSVSMSSLVGIEKWIVLIGFVSLLGPFIEELFFRGFILGFIYDSSKSKKTGTIIGILVSSVCFSLAHWQGLNSVSDYFHLVWILLVAIVNSFMVLRFDSIWPAVGSHVVYNGITAGFMLAGAA